MTGSSDKPASLGLFVVSAAILALEVLHMRILSVQMWYHHAYIIVTMAMLAFAIASDGAPWVRVLEQILNVRDDVLGIYAVVGSTFLAVVGYLVVQWRITVAARFANA